MYMQRDGTEVAAEAQRAPEEAREIFAQMATARRSEALTCAEASVVGPVLGTVLAERVAAFRRERGISSSNAVDLASQSPTADEAGPSNKPTARPSACSCTGGCTFLELQQNFWICEKGGHVHACGGDACTEREVDKAGDMFVCSITGRCFPRLMSEWEEAGGRGGGGDDDVAGVRDGEDPSGGDWNATEGMGGRLGRAFFAGYHATDGEMLMRFGIRM